jgi:hypothetical protein
MAGVKITDLEVLLEAASDDLLYIVDVSDNTSGPQGTSKAIEVGDLRGYKVYSALLTQTGSDAPVATVLENNTGKDFTWQYDSTGNYYVSDTFDISKTTYFFSSVLGAQPYFIGGQISSSSISITTTDFSSSSDGLLSNTPIEIRIYN